VLRRTAVVNQVRSLLLERVLTLPKGRSHVDALLPRILEDAELKLSDSFRVLLAQLQVELDQLTGRLGLSSRTYATGTVIAFWSFFLATPDIEQNRAKWLDHMDDAIPSQ
jgi:hypothetical protein